VSTSDSTTANHQSRLRQFSVRSLLVGVAVLGVLLGWIGIEIRQQREERRLCSSCTQLGATITYTGEEGGRVTELNLSNCSDLTHLKELASFSRLRTLWLNRNEPDLRYKLTGHGLAALVKFPALRELHVDRDLLTEDGLRHLKQLSNLEKLTIWGLRYDDPRGDELVLAMPWCKVGW